MKSLLLINGTVVNEGKVSITDLLIRNGRIEKIEKNISAPNATIIDLKGLHIFPGAIDDQVHFREPGLTHKGDLYTEPKAAVAGGITSFMEMPNTSPPALSHALLEEKYQLAAEKSLANYSFYLGASNDNYEAIMRTDGKKICGLKIFMGSSTGNLLVDNEEALERIFANSELLIATHCESEPRIRRHLQEAKEKYGEDVPIQMHPIIRDEEACYESSAHAVTLATKHGTRLHILHISTAKELQLFRNDIPLIQKRITAEACIHHLWFSDQDYDRLGSLMKWNPAIKTVEDREAIIKAVLDNTIDVVATDHAPHTLEEKNRTYFNSPSGGPLVQHALPAMLEFYHQGKISLVHIAQKMAHDVADCFQISDRGYIREGFFADLAVVNLNQPWIVSKENILAKCGWSPFDGQHFSSTIVHTFVNGNLVYSNGKFNEEIKGQRLHFNR